MFKLSIMILTILVGLNSQAVNKESKLLCYPGSIMSYSFKDKVLWLTVQGTIEKNGDNLIVDFKSNLTHIGGDKNNYNDVLTNPSNYTYRELNAVEKVMANNLLSKEVAYGGKILMKRLYNEDLVTEFTKIDIYENPENVKEFYMVKSDSDKSFYYELKDGTSVFSQGINFSDKVGPCKK